MSTLLPPKYVSTMTGLDPSTVRLMSRGQNPRFAPDAITEGGHRRYETYRVLELVEQMRRLAGFTTPAEDILANVNTLGIPLPELTPARSTLRVDCKACDWSRVIPRRAGDVDQIARRLHAVHYYDRHLSDLVEIEGAHNGA
jgi:hypothetical protein